MRTYEREVYQQEMKLMKEIFEMKFSFRKLGKIIELHALLTSK